MHQQMFFPILGAMGWFSYTFMILYFATLLLLSTLLLAANRYSIGAWLWVIISCIIIYNILQLML